MTDYLPHDIDASDDARLQELQMEMKGQGYAIWWRLLELLWKNEGRLPYKPALLAYNIRWCTAEEVDRVITGFGLFVVEDGQFWSEGLLARLEARNSQGQQRSEIARQKAYARWRKNDAAAEAAQNPENAPEIPEQCSSNAAAMRQQCSSNANNTTQHITTQHLSLSEGACAREREGEQRDRERIFEKFFFRNFLDPTAEVERYWGNYAGQGWQTSKGQPITDRVAYCSGWKPKDERPRFARDALLWYQNFFKEAAPGIKDPARLLTRLLNIIRGDDECIYLRFNDLATATDVADWCATHGGYAAVKAQVARKNNPKNNRQ